jgi:hypothetical protein
MQRKKENNCLSTISDVYVSNKTIIRANFSKGDYSLSVFASRDIFGGKRTVFKKIKKYAKLNFFMKRVFPLNNTCNVSDNIQFVVY